MPSYVSIIGRLSLVRRVLYRRFHCSRFTLCRYDVELYQRIEALISKKLPLYRTVEEEVLALMERVAEAQRHAKMVGGANGCGQL